ncbi:MAG: ferric reductase-like transmembrane domain-containing protein [Gaiellaceae bacterium]
MNSAKELWYLTRGSGAVALLLLTSSVALGVLVSLRSTTKRWPRFAINALHRNMTLIAIAFVGLHVVTTVADGYAPIGLKDALVPFVSPYRPIWLGLGAVAFDLLLALVITSFLRHRIGIRLWRGVHWLAYAAWPVALVHSFGTGSDSRTSWLVLLGFGSLFVVAAAVLVRLVVGSGDVRVRAAGFAAAVAAPLAVFLWWHGGPAQTGWASRAGTPASLMASHRRVASRTVLTSATQVSAPTSFESPLTGSIRQVRRSDGLLQIVIRLSLGRSPRGQLRIDLRGTPLGDGVSMIASGVSFVPASTRAVYYGSITGLDGSIIAASVKDAVGDTLQLTVRLSLDAASGRASGVVVAGRGGA